MIIKIDSLDTLFFRDGKPFGSSDDNWASSLNYPNLSTIYGAIRSTYFSQNNLDINKADSSEDITKNLRINGIYFYDNEEETLLFKVPQDLYIVEDKLKLFKLIKNKSTNNPLEYIFEAKDEDIEKKEVFITESTLLDYLELFKPEKEEEIEFSFYEVENYIRTEAKIGIGRNKNRKSIEEGKLYRVGAKRYNNLSIIVDFDGINLKEKGLMRLGGEGKGVYYEEFFIEDFPKIKELSSDIFKTYLLTPAIFRNGWCPDFLDKEFKGEINGVKVQLIAAALGKNEFIGGWDIKNNLPKKMYKAVPSGSVYYFKVIDGNPFNISNLMDNEFREYKKQGFGKVIIGDYKEK